VEEFKHFKLEEFECPCCGANRMNLETVERLDKARELSGVPYAITSGFRCALRNKSIGGAETSTHLAGRGADILTPTSTMRYKIIKGLLEAGFTRIGIYPSHVHADDHPDYSQEVMWYV